MKSLRIWILLVLAFALPMRGALAAAQPCAPMAPAAEVATVDVHAHEHGHASHGAAHAHAHDDGAGSAGHDASDKCSSCASCCSASATVAGSLVLPQARPVAAAFVEVAAPAAEFLSSGPERPPRST